MTEQDETAVDQLLREAEDTIEQSLEDISFLDDEEKEVVFQMIKDGKTEEAKAILQITARSRMEHKSILQLLREAIPYV